MYHAIQIILFQNGSTCAHIAAAKGSVGVLLELMKFDKSVVIHARNKERSRWEFGFTTLVLPNGAMVPGL